MEPRSALKRKENPNSKVKYVKPALSRSGDGHPVLHNTKMSKQTDQLRQNIQSQIDRLVKQLEDLEEEKADLSKDEYEEMRNETLAEMEVFRSQMVKMLSGDMSLITEFQGAQMVQI